MAQNVFFKRGSALPESPVMTTFYLINDTDLYIGGTKLNNQSEINAAVVRIAQNETDIAKLEKSVATLLGDGSGSGSITEMISSAVDAAKTELQKSIDANTTAIAAEKTRAEEAEAANAAAIAEEASRAKGVENDLNTAIAAEKTRAEGAEANLGTLISNEVTRAQTAEGALEDRIEAIEGDYYPKAEGDALSNKVVTNEATLTALKADVDTFFADADLTANAKDTLKELQDYIASDESGAAAMAASIKTNADAIDAINNADTGILAQSKEYTDGQVSSAVTQVNKYTDNEIDKVEASISTLTQTVSNKADTSTVETLAGKVTTNEGDIATLKTDVDAVENQAAGNASAIAALQAAIGDFKASALGSAAYQDVETLNTAAQGYANTALSNAQTYADNAVATALTWQAV